MDRGDDNSAAAEFGRRVLANLAGGRKKAHRLARENSAPIHLEIRRELDRDILAGYPVRGRAKRIAGTIPPRMVYERAQYYSVRQVQRILDGLANMS